MNFRRFHYHELKGLKYTTLFFFMISLSNLSFGQIKSEKQVQYWFLKAVDQPGFHENISNDTCILFWEEYNPNGKITKRYNFPSDRCWRINGIFEHHFFYDNRDRIIEHRRFFGEDGEEKLLTDNSFYSYPRLNEPYKANEILLIYNLDTPTRAEAEKIDTFYIDTITTKGMFDIVKTNWKFDTLRFEEGDFILRNNFKRGQNLFSPSLIYPLLGKNNIKDFEIALMNNIVEIADKLTKKICNDKVYPCEFEFKEKMNNTSTNIILSDYSIEVTYKFLNQLGDCNLAYHYKSERNGKYLKKMYKIKSYIEYYKN